MNCYENFDNILLDCDGVLWDGMTPIEGSVETVAKMKVGTLYMSVNSN